MALAIQSNGNLEIDEILVGVNKFTRTLTLNRPRKLNAITYQMMSHLRERFISYETDPNVKLVILKGNGKAFCAGGDIAAVVHKVAQGGHWGVAAKLFSDEFSLDYIVATHSKPLVSILDGAAMGIGASLTTHGRFRVATEKTVFAMPETALGNAPNGGGSYFLPRLQGFLGEYIGLTGARLEGAEMLACGLATHFVPRKNLKALEEALTSLNTDDAVVISLTIDEFSESPALKAKSAFKSLDIINMCFSKGTVEEIMYALESESANRGGEGWISRAIESLKAASPLALKFSLASIRLGRTQSIGQCLVREFRLMCHILRREVSSDFFEGCRAMLIDKDRKPKWAPSRLELVTDEMVNHYFTKVNDDKFEDLRLYVKPNNTSSSPLYYARL